MKNIFKLEKSLATQIATTDALNNKLMAAVLNGGKGTATLERKAEASAKTEETLKAELTAAKTELCGVIYRATQALKQADRETEKQLDAFFANLPKAKKTRKTKADKAKIRREAKELDNDAYLARCAKEQQKADDKAKAEAEKAAREAARKAAREEAARKAREVAEMTEEAAKEVALGATPEVAKEAVIRADRCSMLLEDVIDELQKQKAERDELLRQTRELKVTIAETMAGLKAPSKSSRVRSLLLRKALLEKEISDITAARRINQKICTQTGAELKALKKQIKYLLAFGNAAVRPTTMAAIKDLKVRRRQMAENLRKLATIEERAIKDSFQLPAFSQEYFQQAAGLDVLFADVNGYNPAMQNSVKKEEARLTAMAAIETLRKMAQEKKPIRLKYSMSRPSRIQLNFLAMAMSIDCESKAVQTDWINVEHGIQESLKPSWKLFSSKKAEGLKLAKEFVALVFELLDNIIMVSFDGKEAMYHGLYASASHQKKEKLVLCKEELLNLHEGLVWFGKTKAEVLQTSVTGAEIWKMRANLARPIAFAVTLKDGRKVYLRNIMMVPDVKKTYHHSNAVKIGGDHNGQPYEFGEADNPVVLGDGESISAYEMNSAAWQGGGVGYKTMCVYSPGSFERNGVTLPEGKYIVCGDGCFKFDKVGYASWDEFAARMDELAKRYPGINQVYVLRQSEEVEDEDRIRRISRSLTQQFMIASDEELHQLANPAVNALNRMKTFEGLFTILAELNIPEEKRSDFARLIFACPELLTNDNVQLIAKAKWTSRQNEAIGNKCRTKGQYPYIVQDPDALVAVWLCGADPDDPNLGVLKAGEASLVGLPEGMKVGAIRYPANALTVKVVVNRPMADFFGMCGNVAILSIHDDILIYQDGDVDGDEMGILYDQKIVELIERMHRVLKPYVIVFEHGSKAERIVIADAATEKGVKPEDELRTRMYSSLWSAKEFDSVGKYANLARDCAFLANIELKEMRKARAAGNDRAANEHWTEFKKFILWMAAASTGAILAIDQVKGNAVDPKLIAWLEAIADAVRNDRRMQVMYVDENGEEQWKYAQPFTQPFVKDDFTISARPANRNVCTDEFGMYVKDKTGEYVHDGQGFMKNDAMLRRVLLDSRHPLARVRSAAVTKGVVLELRANYFNRSFVGKDGKVQNPDADVFALIKAGRPVSQEDLLLLYWRNQCTLEFRDQAKKSIDRKAAYYSMVRESLIEQALSQPWFCESEGGSYEFGHKFTDEEKIASVVGNAVCYALELGRKNHLDRDSKGSFAKFVLCVFARDLLENIQRNDIDLRHFMQEGYEVITDDDAGYESTDFSLLEDVDECCSVYDSVEEPPALTDEELERMAPDFDEEMEMIYA